MGVRGDGGERPGCLPVPMSPVPAQVPKVAISAQSGSQQGPYGHGVICPSVLTRCHSSTIITPLTSRAVPGQMFCLSVCLSANRPSCFPPSAFLGGCPMVSHSLEVSLCPLLLGWAREKLG